MGHACVMLLAGIVQNLCIPFKRRLATRAQMINSLKLVVKADGQSHKAAVMGCWSRGMGHKSPIRSGPQLRNPRHRLDVISVSEWELRSSTFCTRAKTLRIAAQKQWGCEHPLPHWHIVV